MLSRMPTKSCWRTLASWRSTRTGVFQSVDLTFTAIDAITDDLTDEQIKANEHALHVQLSKLEKASAVIDAIFIADKDGRALVSSAIYPVPGNAGVADRDYFLAQKENDAGTYIGAVLEPRVREGNFFGVSRRRLSHNGEFAGIVMVAVEPKIFTDFYAQLARDAGGGGFSLAKSDGMILARYPEPSERHHALRTRQRLHAQRAALPERRHHHHRSFGRRRATAHRLPQARLRQSLCVGRRGDGHDHCRLAAHDVGASLFRHSGVLVLLRSC